MDVFQGLVECQAHLLGPILKHVHEGVELRVILRHQGTGKAIVAVLPTNGQGRGLPQVMVASSFAFSPSSNGPNKCSSMS